MAKLEKNGENVAREKELQSEESERAVFKWYYGSNSFNIVLILAAGDNMKGGKTDLKNSSDAIAYIDGPKIGYATVLPKS